MKHDWFAKRLGSMAVVVLIASAGCSSASAPADEAPTEQPDDAAVADPSPEELAEHPCSNPSWDEPPPEPVSLEETEE